LIPLFCRIAGTPTPNYHPFREPVQGKNLYRAVQLSTVGHLRKKWPVHGRLLLLSSLFRPRAWSMKNIQPQLADIPTEARLNQTAAKPTYALTSVASTMSSSKTSRWGPSQDLCDFIPPEDDARYRLSFWQAFGLLGIPILLLLGICLSWTLWLMLLTVAPNGIANLLMKTAEYDSGLFWLIVEDPVAIQVASIVGLTGIELYYVYILAKVLVWRTVEAPLVRALSRHKAKMALLFKPSRVAASDKATTPLREMWTELTGFHGKHRKFWVRLTASVRLAFVSRLILDFPR